MEDDFKNISGSFITYKQKGNQLCKHSRHMKTNKLLYQQTWYLTVTMFFKHNKLEKLGGTLQ